MSLIPTLPLRWHPGRTLASALIFFVVTSAARAQLAAQLNSIARTSPSPLAAGASLTYSFSITAGSNPVQSIAVEFYDPGMYENLAGDTGSASGTITLSTSAATWLNGSYVVRDIIIHDTAGIVSEYDANGTSFSVSYPLGGTGVATSSIDPTTLGFTLAGGQGAIIAPSLTSLSFESNTVAAGGIVTVDYSIALGTIPTLGTVTLTLRGSTGPLYLNGFLSTPSGTFTAMVPTTAPPDTYSLSSVFISDSRGGVVYQADGTIGYVVGESGASPFPGSFSTLGLTVPVPPTPTPSPAPTPSPTPTPPPTPTPTPTPTPEPTPTPPPLPPVAIIAQPSSTSASIGETVAFSVSASGPGSLSYQWSFNGEAIPGATSSTFSISSAKTSDSGSYTVTVAGSDGSAISNGAILAVAPASGGPTFSVQPTGSTIAPGSSVVFNAGSGAAGATYQWYLNGLPIAVSTPAAAATAAVPFKKTGQVVSGPASATLFISDATAADAGTYRCLVTTTAGSALGNPATLTIASSNDPGRLINLSCRAPVGTGADILIAGFVVGGQGTNGTEPVLLRGSGPALAGFSVAGVLPDPVLNLFNSDSQMVASNSGWGGSSAISAASASVGAFAWTEPLSHDAAVDLDIPSGAYTAQISGASNDSGVALAEVYDARPAGPYAPASPRLINVSARVRVGTGANILIAGLVVGGSTSKTVLIRASGPALAQFAVSGTLPDPQLQVFNSSNQAIAANDGWAANAQISSVAQAVGAFGWGPSATADSALLLTLPPGAYTVQVSGAGGDTGVALVEIYDVP